MSDVLVTGGTGVIGRALLDGKPKGTRVTVTSRDAGAFLAAYPRFKRKDIIMHERGHLPVFASVIHAERSLPQWALACAGRRFLFISSGAAKWHLTPYGDMKRRGEEICRENKDGLTISIARLYTVAGPDIPLGYAFGRFIADAKAGLVRLRGGLQAVRTYLHTADAAAWLWAMLEIGGEYEVASKRKIMIAQLACLVAEHAQCPMVVEQNSSEEADRYVPEGPFPPGCVERFTIEDAIREALAA